MTPLRLLASALLLRLLRRLRGPDESSEVVAQGQCELLWMWRDTDGRTVLVVKVDQ